MRKLMIAAAVLASLAPRAADAFCGFYVNGAGGEMFNDATQVVLMRMNARTVLSMQNNYKGPPEAFALVIPVPTVLQEADVKTLSKDVFARVDAMGAPRLVEYWEQDPCGQDVYPEAVALGAAGGMKMRMEASKGDGKDLGVTIEAQFQVGEYQIVILSATDSAGLDTWLRQEKYTIPPGAEPLLRPYVEANMKFFVAKVDPTKVTFDKDNRAELSPLRFHYDSEEFTLPIRLGLANSSGTQDLIVSILAPNQRYDVANYKNVTIPTNLDVKDAVRDSFGEFYAALFDRTVEKNPGAVVTEYAWMASTCDPCPGPNLNGGDFATLGGDVLAGEPGKVAPYEGWDLVLTRLHARYGKTVTEDLVFKKAEAIAGGREHLQANGKLEERSQPAGQNNFQARYAIRHEWTGAITCKDPRRGRWGGPPSGIAGGGVKPALDLAFAPRGKASLPTLVRQDIPEIEVKAAGAVTPETSGTTGDRTGSATGTSVPEPGKQEPKKKTGCGCSTPTGDDGAGALGLAAVVGLLIVRRKRSHRCAS
jgi:MYXO-CTERM domain-containing protein